MIPHKKSSTNINKKNSVITPNLSISSPIKIRRKTYIDDIKNKFKQEDKVIVKTNIRKDQSGYPITKNSKMHRVTFCDQINFVSKERVNDPIKDLYEIILIESYKRYNKIDDDNNNKLTTSKILACRCNII
jgi:hypothetical protein